MTLQELIVKNNIDWKEIKETLLEKGEHQSNMLAYLGVFEYLKDHKTKDDASVDFEIEITRCKDDFGGQIEYYIDVSGYKDEKYVAIEFVPWEQWVKANLTERTINGFTPNEIICYCMQEMTFVSFDENEIQSKMKEIENSINEIKMHNN